MIHNPLTLYVPGVGRSKSLCMILASAKFGFIPRKNEKNRNYVFKFVFYCIIDICDILRKLFQHLKDQQTF